jgi:para-nitrobenzyl esterase
MQDFAAAIMKIHRLVSPMLLTLLLGVPILAARAQELRRVQVTTPNGVIEGVVSADGLVRSFKGIRYAMPPIGPLRWKPPQPAPQWMGVQEALDYGPRAMQGHIYDDMVFHDNGPSEDCLYLNVWMPENPPTNKLPVMVWIHGGGFVAGASSEPRQDGGNLSKLGVMVVSFNYRMGVFGFFAHRDLAKESPHNASGNYGLLDQVAALQWVHDNIASFGGDPDNVTIFGESAGSFSVSALMASPLSQGLFQRAIGESGAMFSKTRPTKTLAEAQLACLKYSIKYFGTSSLDKLRGLTALQLLTAATNLPHDYFTPDIDGYFLPEDCASTFTAGRQSHVPLLAGWNKDEGWFKQFYTNEPPLLDKNKIPITEKEPVFAKGTPTLADYVACAKMRFGDQADEFLKLYPATTDAEAKRAAADYAGDRFIAYGTWKWIDLQLQTGGDYPIYRYLFEQPLPLAKDAKPGSEPSTPHASDIEFIFRMLSSRNLPWKSDDKKVSEMMAAYWVNFAKNGDPNGPGLPNWPQYKRDDGYQVMHLQAKAAAAPDRNRPRYEFLDQLPLPW